MSVDGFVFTIVFPESEATGFARRLKGLREHQGVQCAVIKSEGYFPANAASTITLTITADVESPDVEVFKEMVNSFIPPKETPKNKRKTDNE